MDNPDLPNTFLCTIVFHAHESVPSPAFPFRYILYGRMEYIFLPPVQYMIHFVNVAHNLGKLNRYHISIYEALSSADYAHILFQNIVSMYIFFHIHHKCFEDIQKRKIIDKINSKYLVAKNITREQQIRPGMDAIVYDKEKKHLQVIELKYKLPIESTSDLINLDAMLNKAYNQIKIAEEMVEGNKTFILEEYFGESFKGIIPDFVDYFVITNYSVGTGRNCILPSPIILESHYLSMMKLNNGMYNVHYALSDNGKGYIQHVEKRYARYLLSGYKIMVPEYLFKINAPRV